VLQEERASILLFFLPERLFLLTNYTVFLSGSLFVV